MWRVKQSISFASVGLLGILLSVAPAQPARAETAANTPSLVISQLKITASNGQFLTLYNATNTTLDMSKYQLEYFNSYDLTKATSSRLISLSGILPPHGYFMINDSSLLLCYQLTVDSVSLGFSSTAGMVEVLAFNQSIPGASAVPVLQDYIGWSKTAAPGAQTLPVDTNAFLQRSPADSGNNPLVTTPGAGNWLSVKPDGANACNIVSSSSNTMVVTGLSQLLPSTEPPVNSIQTTDSGSPKVAAIVLPARDIGLMAPTITEILPNPAGTGNDATDEFIELYNANPVSFDLSGFSLQSGSRTYKFPVGASLAPLSFTAFYSKTTGLSLSNSGGQAKLLEPAGNSISASNPYGNAKDGQAWALANGKWYWTETPTPGKANSIHEPLVKVKTAAKAGTTKARAAKARSAKTKSKKAKLAKSFSPASADTPDSTPVHMRTLALVATLALLYGLYEYRTDIANKLYQVKRYFGNRHEDRQ